MDAPANEMHTDTFIEVMHPPSVVYFHQLLPLSMYLQKIQEVAGKLGLEPPLVIQGEELREKGFGGEEGVV